MNQQTPALELFAVTYNYPNSQLGVHDISLTATSGGIHGLVGVNGAGKTTLMRLMIGLLRPDAGHVQCLGNDLKKAPRAKFRSIGSLIEVPSVYSHLTGRRHLKIFADYTSTPAGSIDTVLDLVGLADDAERIVGSYSLGMKQRLALATALLHDPKILILDEPANGLDPMGIAKMRDILSRLANDRGKTIIVSSHQLDDLQKIATTVSIIHRGILRFNGTAAELKAAVGQGEKILRLRVSSVEKASVLLSNRKLSTASQDGIVRIRIGQNTYAPEITRTLINAGIDISEAVVEEGSLEQDFLNFLRQTENDA